MIATTEQVITEEFQESPPDIVKVRVMGTKEDINWISALLKTNPFFHVIDQSDIYSNHGTKKYFRSYLQIARKEVKHDLNKNQKRRQRKTYLNKKNRRRGRKRCAK